MVVVTIEELHLVLLQQMAEVRLAQSEETRKHESALAQKDRALVDFGDAPPRVDSRKAQLPGDVARTRSA